MKVIVGMATTNAREDFCKLAVAVRGAFGWGEDPDLLVVADGLGVDAGGAG